ncbi:MAG: bifunctional DNA-formamidopyrimidine glycosylase/DNA-(apurinic or apyrimidinic site) lyase, partial [Candidatus Paceibacterota bacterium]
SMPELPEVESLRISLKPYIVGKYINAIIVHKPKLVSGSGTIRQALEYKKQEFESQLIGAEIVDITRIAKNLIIHLSTGQIILIHLKMTGQLVYQDNNQNKVLGGHPIELSESKLPNQHSHIIFKLDQGTLYYNDIRMFGYVLLYPDLDTIYKLGHFDKIGLDPFDDKFTAEYLYKHLKAKKSKLKTILLNQEIVTGLGNIYADEVCFKAGILPIRLANTLTKKEVNKLYQAIVIIIPKAVEMGGSSIANYIMADGSRGTYAREHKVYGKAGKQCFGCEKPLQKTVINSRTTVFCQFCQR